MGYSMTLNKLVLTLVLFSTFSCSSCSGPTKPGGTPPPGAGSIALTLVADTRPANPAILSLRVTLTGISLTAATGAPQSLTLNPQPVIDLVRLQPDSAFLGTFTGVRAGQYTGVTVSFANPVITFRNDTPADLTSPPCLRNAVCQATLTAAGAPQATLSFAVASTTPIGVGLDFNLGTAVSISGPSLSLSFSAPNTLTAFALPRTGSTLSAGQLDLIEDFTGVASITGNTVTITSPTRGTLTATATSSTNFDPSPYPARSLCNGTSPTLATCVSNNQIVSADAILKSDGTLSLQEIEPLLASRQDIIEGTVVAKTPASTTQFTIVTTDKQTATPTSLISSVNIGDLVVVSLPPPPTVPNPFLVDTKGLPVTSCCATIITTFTSGTNTDAIHVGQTVALHVTGFTPASGSVPPSVNVDTAILRWSRFIATATGAASTTSINVKDLPSYFAFTPASIFAVQIFTGTPGGPGVTNLDGLPTAANVVIDKPTAVRALYFLQNDTTPATPPFAAAKLRQH